MIIKKIYVFVYPLIVEKKKYVTSRRKRFRPYKVYFDMYLAMSVCLYERCDLKKHGRTLLVEYLDYQIPVTQLKGPKRNGDIQAAKRDWNATPSGGRKI